MTRPVSGSLAQMKTDCSPVFSSNRSWPKIQPPPTKGSFGHNGLWSSHRQGEYQVQFDKPGTYFLYMRFTMFEMAENQAHYINEFDSLCHPISTADPQTLALGCRQWSQWRLYRRLLRWWLPDHSRKRCC